jgi:hypothetical protein
MASIASVYVDILPAAGKIAASNPIDGVDFSANNAKRRKPTAPSADSRAGRCRRGQRRNAVPRSMSC